MQSSTKKIQAFDSTWTRLFEKAPNNTIPLQSWDDHTNVHFTGHWASRGYWAWSSHFSMPQYLSWQQSIFIPHKSKGVESFESKRLRTRGARTIIRFTSLFRHGRFTWLHPTMLAIQFISSWNIKSIHKFAPIVRYSDNITCWNIEKVVNLVPKVCETPDF